MAATGYTPIYLYYSSTAAAAPSAGNLGYGELALNITDKNLFFKDNTNTVNTVPIRQASGSSNGWLSSTDWTTFNSKQPAGTYVTSVSGTAPVVSSGGTTPAISMAAATSSANGYLTSTDWTTFNGKQAALVSGTNIKTVNGTTLLGSGDLGTIGVGYGGTGLTSLTANYIPYGNGTGAFNSSSSFTYNGVLTVGSASSQNGVFNVVVGSGGANQGLVIVPSSTGKGWIGFNNANNASIPGQITYDFSAGLMNLFSSGDTSFTTGASGTTAKMFASGGVSIGNTTDPGAGNFTINGATATKASGTTWANPSDIRLKENIQDFTKGLVELLQINPCTWEYNGKGGTTAGTKGIGVIADDVENILPESVDTYMARLDNEYEEPVKRFDATEITWLLVNAVKQLSYEISVLRGNK